MRAIQVMRLFRRMRFHVRLGALTLCGIFLVTTGCSTSPSDRSQAVQSDPKQESFDTASNRPPTPQTLYSMARILSAQGRDAQCAAVYTRIIRENPEFRPAYSGLAEVQLRNRRIDDAIVTLSSGLRIAPRDPVLLNDIGMCYMIQRRYEEALVNFTQAVGASPSDARYRTNMATVLGLLGRYDESLALYLHVLPPHEAHYNLGVLCEARKDADRAATEFRTSDELLKQAQNRNASAPPAKTSAPAAGGAPTGTGDVAQGK